MSKTVTITMDFDEYQKTLVESQRTSEEIRFEAQRLFVSWRDNYENARKSDKEEDKKDLLKEIKRVKEKCLKRQSILGYMNVDEVEKYFEELEGIVKKGK